MMIRRTLLLFFIPLMLIGFLGVHAQAEDWQMQFEQIIQDEMTYYNIPGAAVAVINGGELIYAQGFGVRDVSSGEPFTTETRFRIGSTTKSMTSLMIAQLVDEGMLSWDTPVTDILPDFATSDPALTSQITVRDLMSMATGLVSTTLDAFDWGQWDFEDLLNVVAAQTIDGEFRNSHNYNNEVYAIAGYVGAAASGMEPTLDSYKALMQTRVFDPIGMESAIITDDHALLGDNYAHPYQPNLLGEEGEQELMIDPPIAIASPSGAVWTTIEDMAKYVITQMNGGVTPDGTRIVSAESLAETWRPGAPLGLDVPGYEDAHYGLGWVTQTYRDIPMLHHNGSWSGYTTQMTIFPDSDSAILVFSNSNLGGQLNDTLAFTFAELWYGLDLQAAEQRRGDFEQVAQQIEQVRRLALGEFDAESAAPITGTYADNWVVDYRDDSSLWLTHRDRTFRLAYVEVLGQYLVINNGGLGAIVNFDTASTPASLTITVGEGLSETFVRVD